jgi:hypothetical protein
MPHGHAVCGRRRPDSPLTRVEPFSGVLGMSRARGHVPNGHLCRPSSSALPSPPLLFEQACHRLQELPGDVGVLSDDPLKVPPHQDEAAEICLGRNGGLAFSPSEKGEFTKGIAGGEHLTRLPAYRYLRLALADDEEAVALLPLLGHSVAWSKASLVHRIRDLFERLPIESGEERDVPKEIYRSVRHPKPGLIGEQRKTVICPADSRPQVG